MQCTNCKSDNPDGAHFCGKCGAQISSAFSSSPGPVDDLGSRQEHDAPVEVRGEPQVDFTSPISDKPPANEPVLVTKVFPDDEEAAAIAAYAESPQSAPVNPGHQAVPPPDPNAPGAGLAPPQKGFVPPPHASGAQPYTGYGHGAMGNTSGMGTDYPAPPEAEGWTFAGFIPYGLYSFVNGNLLWGFLWWAFSIFGLNIVYWIIIGLNGKKQAWQNRRFDSVEQFTQTMQAWNTWGIVVAIVQVIGIVLWFTIFSAAFIAALSDPEFSSY